MRRTAVPTVAAHLQAERSLLGALLLARTLFGHVVAAGLRREHFYLSAHRQLFSALLGMHEHGIPIDMITVTDTLGSQGVAQLGGYAYLCLLTEGCVTVPSHVQHHVKIILRDARLRQLAGIGERLQAEACVPGAKPAELGAATVEALMEAINGWH
jgi:replicative DNA helicase